MKQIISKDHFEKIITKGFVATIGNFDGVHLGHRALLTRLKEIAGEKGLETLVITFTPHPRQILLPTKHFLLSTAEEKRMEIFDSGINYVYEIPFHRDFSRLPPEEFLREYIFSIPKLRSLVVGHDFVFGPDKSGGRALIEKMTLDLGKDYEEFSSFSCDGVRVSSTHLRELVLKGDVKLASKFLGRPYMISSRVIKGDCRGRLLGFPTANMERDEAFVIPKRGVYATKTQIGKESYLSLTNIGLNPTFVQNEKIKIETHILDFSRDIYGEEIQLFFIDRIRDEEKFANIDLFVEQLSHDIAFTKRIFK